MKNDQNFRLNDGLDVHINLLSTSKHHLKNNNKWNKAHSTCGSEGNGGLKCEDWLKVYVKMVGLLVPFL